MILLYEFSYMMGLYLITLILVLLYLKRKIGTIFHSIEGDKNITDLLFLKLLLDFIYKNNLLINLETVMSNLRVNPGNNILDVFKDIIPEAENEIEGIYKPLHELDSIKQDYDMIIENYIWLLYLTLIYGTIMVSSYIIYYFKIFSINSFPNLLIILSMSVYIIAVISSIVMITHIFILFFKSRKEMNHALT